MQSWVRLAGERKGDRASASGGSSYLAGSLEHFSGSPNSDRT